jgi:hypothetical protein
MAVGDYDIAPFISPVGTDIATVQTRGNDNVLRDKFVAHQADEVAHVQSGLASAKPAFGTAAGEVYIATDTGQMWMWSGTAWVSYNVGYAISVHALSFSPADGSTQYFGNVLRAPVTTANQSQMYFNVPGKITAAEIYWYATGVAGSGENISVYVRKNNVTDYIVATTGTTTAAKRFSRTDINPSLPGVPIAVNDYVEIKMTCPTWATNPTNVVLGGYIIFVPST